MAICLSREDLLLVDLYRSRWKIWHECFKLVLWQRLCCNVWYCGKLQTNKEIEIQLMRSQRKCGCKEQFKTMVTTNYFLWWLYIYAYLWYVIKSAINFPGQFKVEASMKE